MKSLVESKNQPRVSVLMLAYNHAPYIEQAVKSILDQEFSEAFEIVIGDDCSTDDTLEIARTLERQHPGLIRVLASEVNLGITPNFIRLLKACRAPYIAMLEGDDYWVDVHKLQYQFNMLETDKSLSCCAGLTKNRVLWVEKKPRYGLDDLLRRYIFHTSTLFFRRELLPDLEPFRQVHALDSFLFAFLAERGDCGFIDRELSYYRRHEGGAWTGKALGGRIAATQQVTDMLSSWSSGAWRKDLFERELWVYGLMTQIDINMPLMRQNRQNLCLLRRVLPRLFRAEPFQATGFALRIIVQPLTKVFTLVRFRLGLGEKLKRLLAGNT